MAAAPQKHDMSTEIPVGVRLLEDLLVVAVEGEDARTWLNGQITNDLKRLDASRSVYGLVLTSKGRVLADVTVLERGGALFFETARASWPALHEQLEKFIIMEDVTLRETDLRAITVIGPRRNELEAALEGLGASVASGDRLGPSIEVLVPATSAAEALTRLTERARSLGGEALDEPRWERLRIAAGVPRFAVDFGERTYPQEAGLKRRALSFDKGCYHGQEVICMLENRGQVTRSLVRLRLGAPAVGGTEIRRGDDVVGEVTSAADGSALAFVKRALAEAGGSVEIGGATATIEEAVT